MLRLVVKVGDTVKIEGVGTIHVEERSGRSVRLGFETPLGPITIQKRDDESLPALTRRQAAMDQF
ncbi:MULTISPECIES: hypothetical protein [Agrobacterium tumefaciens complex]|uniref:Carbon storage regulator n=1 Tax=Agrobacterium tomkonis CFBP 6623 TaxID=1183432 RepID=A0A1S7PEW8_9HYPH|nr:MULTISPECIES: hypothetical protein [Agrobacterium tumefaciens complex]QCL88744.1 hypothetical protein CFBP6623_06075 [Agrobacterium tumefaciens]CUX20190.1 conserved hypothetical protein [Agrobacterium tomkonis CFBP 6623]